MTKIATGLPGHRHGATGNGVRNVATAICQIARISKEEIARLNLTAVIRHARGLDAHGRQTIEDFARLSHSGAFPSLTPATLTGASGGTPSVRSAPPVIWENAGPATSPP